MILEKTLEEQRLRRRLLRIEGKVKCSNLYKMDGKPIRNMVDFVYPYFKKKCAMYGVEVKPKEAYRKMEDVIYDFLRFLFDKMSVGETVELGSCMGDMYYECVFPNPDKPYEELRDSVSRTNKMWAEDPTTYGKILKKYREFVPVLHWSRKDKRIGPFTMLCSFKESSPYKQRVKGYMEENKSAFKQVRRWLKEV